MLRYTKLSPHVATFCELVFAILVEKAEKAVLRGGVISTKTAFFGTPVDSNTRKE